MNHFINGTLETDILGDYYNNLLYSINLYKTDPLEDSYYATIKQDPFVLAFNALSLAHKKVLFLSEIEKFIYSNENKIDAVCKIKEFVKRIDLDPENESQSSCPDKETRLELCASLNKIYEDALKNNNPIESKSKDVCNQAPKHFKKIADRCTTKISSLAEEINEAILKLNKKTKDKTRLCQSNIDSSITIKERNKDLTIFLHKIPNKPLKKTTKSNSLLFLNSQSKQISQKKSKENDLMFDLELPETENEELENNNQITKTIKNKTKNDKDNFLIRFKKLIKKSPSEAIKFAIIVAGKTDEENQEIVLEAYFLCEEENLQDKSNQYVMKFAKCFSGYDDKASQLVLYNAFDFFKRNDFTKDMEALYQDCLDKTSNSAKSFVSKYHHLNKSKTTKK